jgi:serine O-acetyltransferase
MIRTRQDLADYRTADWEGMGFSEWTWRQRVDPSSRARITRFLRRLRRLEFLLAQPHTPWRRVELAVLWRVHLRNAAILSFEIPPGVCGPGLMPAHYGAIAINGDARIGSHCRVHPGVTIGATKYGSPVIGDNAYIGAGAKITGPVQVGDNVVVAPNAVVIKDVPDNCMVAGVPAEIKRRDVPLEGFRP